MSIPKIRFKEFSDNWRRQKFSEFGTFYSGGTPLTSKRQYYTGSIPFIRSGEISMESTELFITEEGLNNSSAKLVCKGDILYALYGATSGEVSISKMNGAINQAILCIRTKQDHSFIATYLRHMKESIINTYLQGGQGNLSADIIKNLIIHLPTLREQQKIADFLTSVDEKINLLKKKKELLERYKKGVMQKIFSQELRFKDEEGKDFPEWEEKELGEVAVRVTLKNKENNSNVLTISARLGLISQLEYYNKSVSSSNITNYYLLHEGDFAYNKSYSNGYPMGAIKRLKKYESGVVSTLYICFRFKEGLSPAFYEHYFESGLHNNQIQLVAQEGARNHGLLNIGVNDFFNTSVPVPSKEEQQKIADFLTVLDDKIALVENQINKTELWKKGLLQQMFV